MASLTDHSIGSITVFLTESWLAMYHEGELEVQRKAGVAELAARVGRIIGNAIPSGAVPFIEGPRLLVASTIDRHGRVWASPLRGGVHVDDERTLRITSGLALDDP